MVATFRQINRINITIVIIVVIGYRIFTICIIRRKCIFTIWIDWQYWIAFISVAIGTHTFTFKIIHWIECKFFSIQ